MEIIIWVSERRGDDSKHDQIEFLFALAHGRNIDRSKGWHGMARKGKRERESAGRLKKPEDLSSNGSRSVFPICYESFRGSHEFLVFFLPPSLPLSPPPPPSCSRFKFTEQRGFALMNIQRNEWTVFSIYQRHSPSHLLRGSFE